MKTQIICIIALATVLFTGCKAEDSYTPGDIRTPMYCKLTFDESLYDAAKQRNTGSNMEFYIYAIGSNPIRLILGDFKKNHNLLSARYGNDNQQPITEPICFVGAINSLEDIDLQNLPTTGWGDSLALPATEPDEVAPGAPASRSIRQKYGYIIKDEDKGIYIAICLLSLKVTNNSATDVNKGVTAVTEFSYYRFNPETGWE